MLLKHNVNVSVLTVSTNNLHLTFCQSQMWDLLYIEVRAVIGFAWYSITDEIPMGDSTKITQRFHKDL